MFFVGDLLVSFFYSLLIIIASFFTFPFLAISAIVANIKLSVKRYRMKRR